MGKYQQYHKLDTATLKEITELVIKYHEEEKARATKIHHDTKRANVKLLLRKYREIVTHVDRAVYKVSQLDYDLKLQDILEMMSSNQRESFRVEAIRENVVTLRILVDHMNKMLESYRQSCEMYGGEEDMRRYRVIMSLYIYPEKKTVEEVAEWEGVDRSTIYRDIDAAADRLAVLFFGIFGLKFL